jgi:multiple sugar transport system substrate-binding protein
MVAPQWPPFMTAALTQWTTSFAGVTKGTTTLPDAFKNYQDAMVKYAKSQGFTVTTS